LANKSTLIYAIYTVLGIMVTGTTLADEPMCKVKETISSENSAELPIKDKIDIHMEDRKDGRYCVVTFDVPILDGYFTARGEQMVNGLDAMESCKVAEQKANKDMVKQLSTTRLNTLAVMECNEEKNNVWEAKVGAVADKVKFRRDPDRPREFKYNGQACFWFRDVEWKGELNPFNGVACQLHDDQYVVVDKF